MDFFTDPPGLSPLPSSHLLQLELHFQSRFAVAVGGGGVENLLFLGPRLSCPSSSFFSAVPVWKWLCPLEKLALLLEDVLLL